jgi:hypothetical protein
MKITLLALTLLAGVAPAFAQSNVDLYIYRTGANTGTDIQANTGNQVWIDEWSTNGTSFNYVQSFDTKIFASGTATSEGLLNFSPDNQYLAFTGYATTNGSSLGGTTGTAVNRTVGVLNASSSSITRTNFADFASGNNPRSAVTTNGTDLWMAGAVGGVRYATTGSTTSTQLSTTVSNIRNVDIVNNQLYVSDSSGSVVRLGTVGTGLPTTSGQTITNLSGIPTSTGSPYSFFFADTNTLYVADDGTSGGIQKYSLTGTAWSLVGTISASGVRGLTGVVDATGVRLYGTTGSSSATGTGTVYTYLDTGSSFSGTANVLFTQTALQTALTNTGIGGAGSSYAFRGIELAVAIPEPSTYAAISGVLALGLSIWLRRRRA